jgi:hypothetical protein
VKFLGLRAWASPRRKDVAPFPRPGEAENENGRFSFVAFLLLKIFLACFVCGCLLLDVLVNECKFEVANARVIRCVDQIALGVANT